MRPSIDKRLQNLEKSQQESLVELKAIRRFLMLILDKLEDKNEQQ